MTKRVDYLAIVISLRASSGWAPRRAISIIRDTGSTPSRPTVYTVLAAQPIEDLPRRLGAAGLHVGQPAQNPFDGPDAITQHLVRLHILHDQFARPV